MFFPFVAFRPLFWSDYNEFLPQGGKFVRRWRLYRGSWSEKDLMSGVSQETLTRLFNGHAAALVLYARQWCAAPEDVVQEAFLLLTRQSAAPENPAGWLYRVVRNGAISASRSTGRRLRREATAAHRSEPWFHAADDSRLDAATAAQALERLPLSEREVVVARIWGGLPFEEIAGLTGASASTVHRRYQAGLVSIARKVGSLMSTEEEPLEFNAIEAALAALAPTTGGLDRDRLMYLAGRASVFAAGEARTFRWAWPVAMAAMTTVAAALLAVVSLRLADPAPADRGSAGRAEPRYRSGGQFFRPRGRASSRPSAVLARGGRQQRS